MDNEKRNKIMQKVRMKIAVSNFEEKEMKINKNSFLRIVASFVIFAFFTTVIGFGGIYAYSSLGGTINGIPILEFWGIKINNSYKDYEIPVENQSIVFKESSVDLVSVIVDDGITLLKFHIKLSDEDKKYLKIGEKVYTDEEILIMKNTYDNYIKQFDKNVENKKEEYKKIIENNQNYTNSIQLSFNTKPVYVDEYGEYSSNSDGFKKSYMRSFNNNRNLIIDNEKIWVECSIQKTEKISENEFNVYQLYFLSEKEIQNKNDFTVMFDNIALINMADEDSKINKDVNESLNNTLKNERFVELDGSIEVKLSKEKILNDSKVLEQQLDEIQYKRINQKIEKITVTPMQIIIKSTTTMNNISLNDLVGYNRNKDNSVNFKTYNIYDENQNIIDNYTFEEKRIITYSDGTQETWSAGDIGTYLNFENATLEFTEYTIIEKNENFKKLYLHPVVNQPIYNKENDCWESKEEELNESFEINFN